MLDSQIAALLPLIHAKKTVWAEFPLAGLRKGLKRSMQALDMSPIDLAEVRDLVMTTPVGDIPARLYRPHSDQAELPLLVYFHGGGWVTFDVDSFDPFCRVLAQQAQCLVLSVEYRLAPEHKFPAGVEDALAAFIWAKQHAVSLGGDGRVGVGGDSAGGNLAAVVSLLTRQQEQRPDVKFLIYPVVDLSQETESFQQFADGHVLERQAMAFFVGHYLNHEHERHDPRVSPLLAEDVTNLPPTFVFTAGFDPLRDEGIAYAQRLAAEGVAAQHHNFAGLVHGFLQMGQVPAARWAIDAMSQQLQQFWWHNR